MKKWEEQQRKKNYSNMIKNAKSSNLGVRKSKGSMRVSQDGEIGEMPFSPSTASSLGVTISDLGSYINKPLNETLIFKLLQSFNL